MRFFGLFFALFSLGLQGTSYAGTDDPLFITQSIAIARKLIVNPPVDLLDKDGKILDADDVFALQQSGQDVSLLNPAPTDIWGSSLTSRAIEYPKEGADGWINIRFDSLVTSPRGLARSRVVTDDENATPYRIVMSWNLHSALMNAELLSQLGYTIDAPKRYAKARLKFDDIDSRDAFLSALSGGTGTLVEQWLITPPKLNDLVIELRDFALEPARIATPPYYWGAISATEMQNRRIVRALLVPLVITSIPESINLWTWEVGKLANERVLLFHPFAGNFQGQLNYEDVRWISRRICSIDEVGLHKVISAGLYPKSIEPLLYEKMKSRRNHLMELFNVPCAPLPVNASLSFPDPETGLPLVRNGKLLRKEFPGYGFSFIGNDPESPLRKDELFRYLKLRGIGVALNAGLEELNGKLLKYDQSDANSYRDQTWAFHNGPREKLNLSATRQLVSGTYFGSESQVQLVDQVSLSATLGYFLGFKNRAIQNIDFGAEVNASISRSYMHVKPMASIQQAVKTPWKDLPVVPKMRALARLFDAEKIVDQDAALNSFLDKFLPGENFSIIDSVDLGTKLGISLPLPPFLPSLNSDGKLSFSSGYDHIILRRTMIQRQVDGTLQITLQRIKKNALTFSLGYSLLVDVMSAEVARNTADAEALVFILDPNLILTKKELNESLKALLMNHDSEALEKNFKPYQFDHEVKSRTGIFKFLPWTFAKYHEAHILEAFAPGSPHDEAHKRELYSIRDRRLKGSDFLGFGSRAASRIGKELFLPNLNGELGDGSSVGLDPSGSFLGNSHWHEVQIESELTPTLNAKTLLTIQESYTGWTLARKKMLRVLARLERRAHEISSESPSLIHKEEFLSTDKLLLFNVSSVLKVSGLGIDNLIEIAKASATEEFFRSKLSASNRIEVNSWQWPDDEEPTDGSEGFDWISSLYDVLRAVPAPGRTSLENKNRLNALYQVGKYLASNANVKEIQKLIGQENSLFQISVTGFRKNDENGDSAYVSDSVGQSNDRVGDGAFASFAREQNISTYEVRGTYLGNGL